LFGGALVLTARTKGITLEAPQIDGFMALTLFLSVGYVLGLEIIRRRLDAEAHVDGRRSVLAGFAAPCVLLGFEVLHGSPVSHNLNYLFATAAGAMTTVAMFAPWTSRIASTVEQSRAPLHSTL